MFTDINTAVDKLLNMDPDPIPRFILLKEFKGLKPESREYQNLYELVCKHDFVKKYEQTQNERGFWKPFHGYTEGVIRKLLYLGLDKQHPCLKQVSDYLQKVLIGEDQWDQYEKQDNILWWPNMFVPLVSSAMLSLIDPDHPVIQEHRTIWAAIAKESFEGGIYDKRSNINAVNKYIDLWTKRPIQPFNYYCLLLMAPYRNEAYLDDNTDRMLVDYCMKEAEGIIYVYNNKLSGLVPITAQNRDCRDFWHWIRALSLISQFPGWSHYKDKYCDWIISQSNREGLWEFPKKFDFVLSNSWRGKNKMIDSSIYVLKFLYQPKAF